MSFNANNICITNWQRLHEKSYFEKHPHYKNWKLDALHIDDEIDNYVGIFKEDDVLEIGCGYGRLMHTVADRINTIIGIDLHEAPLIKAREILKDKLNAKTMLCDGQSIPLEDNSITMAYSFSSMQHMPRSIVRKYIVETLRVLKFGGRFCFQFLSSPKGSQDINHKIIDEQSVGWTSQELIKITNNLNGKFSINEYPLVLIGRV